MLNNADFVQYSNQYTDGGGGYYFSIIDKKIILHLNDSRTTQIQFWNNFQVTKSLSENKKVNGSKYWYCRYYLRLMGNSFYLT